jgi:tape measure domain-containing protein
MADIDIDLSLNAKLLDQNLAKLNKGLAKVGKTADKTATGITSGFKGSALAIGATTAAVVALGKGFDTVVTAAIKFEDLETQLISFTGSAEAAAEQVQRLADFSATTPFRLDELTKANRTLLAFGSSTEESLEQLRQLGEVSAATGEDIGELSRIFGQIQAEGKLTSERFNQLVERGVNIGPTLAKSLGVAESSLKDLRAEGKITSDDVAKAFETMTSEGGVFFGATERQSKTLSGSISTLEDNVDTLAARIGGRLTPALVTATRALSELIGSAAEELKELDPLSERIQEIGNQLERTQTIQSELEKTIARIDSSSDRPAVQARYQKLSGQLETASRKAEELEAQLVKLRQVQAQPIVQQRIEEEEKKTSDKAAEEKAKQQAKEAEAEAERVKKIEEIEKQITDIRVQEQQARQNTLIAGAQTENQSVVDALIAREDALRTKREELEIQKLETDQELKAAEIERARLQEEELTRIKEEGELKRLTAIREAQNNEFNLLKIWNDQKKKFDEQTYEERVSTARTGLAALINLQKSGNKEAFEIGKAAAIAQALIDTPLAAQKAFTSLSGIPVVGPALGAAAAAAAIAAGVGRVNQIRSQTFTGFADGGLAEGGIKGRDSIPALLQDGEVVVPRKKFKDLQFNNDEQTIVLKSLEGGIAETNGLLRLIASNSSGTLSGDALEEKFSSSTPGGIFYEPVDDGLSERDRREIAIIDALGRQTSTIPTDPKNKRPQKQQRTKGVR